MINFIGRAKELNLLKNEFFSNRSHLTVILGKRGVGKTSLLNNFIKEVILKTQDVIFLKFLGNNNLGQKEQVIQFVIDFVFQLNLSDSQKNELLSKIERYQYNWRIVFSLLEIILKEHQCKNKKISIIIDEFAWFQNKNSNFSEEFGNFWNSISINLNCHFIICGSAVSWMLNHILNSKGSLFHKASSKIKLKAFTYLETLEFFKKNELSDYLSFEEQLQYYLLTGGNPRYLNKIKPHFSIKENIENLIYNFSNSNEKEFEILFSSMFNSTKTNIHQKIVLSFKDNNKQTVDGIIKNIKKQFNESFSTATIYKGINELVQTDFLTKTENIANKKEVVYMLSDLFCFYNVKLVEKEKRFNVFNESLLEKYNGYAFEILAFLNVDLIKQAISRNGFETIEYKCQNQDVQIDLLINYIGNRYSIVECKHYNQPLKITPDFQNELRRKRFELDKLLEKKNKKYSIDYIVFSIYGTEQSKTSGVSFFDVNLKDIAKQYGF